MSNIAFIAYDQCLLSSISLPMEMLGAAVDANAAITKSKTELPQIYGAKRKIHCAGGLQISTLKHPRFIKNSDLIVLPAIWRNPLLVIEQQQYLLPLLKNWAAEGVKICAVGSSSSLLAEAGLLDQRAATTHWSQYESFRQRYPAVRLQTDFLITQSDNIFCAASVNSVADLIIYFIELIYSQTVARKVEANFSPEVRKSYASSLYTDGTYKRHSDEDMIRLQHWLHENFKQTLNCSDMAVLLGISIRTLNRRFKATTQKTPLEYLQELKIRYAKDLLQQSNLSIGEIAMQCGYSDTSYFCSSFKRLTTLTPGSYRTAVKAKLFSTPDDL